MTEEREISDARLLLHHAVEAMGSPGIVVDADLAARTPCLCHRLRDGELCHSPGIIGFLSKPQAAAYCPTRRYAEDGVTRRVERFREAAEEAKKAIEHIPRGERLEPWLREMSKSLRARGIDLALE